MWLPGRWEVVPKDKEEPRNIFQKPSPSVQVQITAGQAGRGRGGADGSLTREGVEENDGEGGA